MRLLRKHLSYANIVATMALVFAMSGGALAARSYLITSTAQISPRVLKKLDGAGKARSTRRGATGPRGPEGEEGEEGEKGAKGERGEKGAAGLQGPAAPTTLPSGQSESGYYALPPGAGAGSVATDVTFPIPLAVVIPESQVIYAEAGVPVAHCAGPGQADRGFLCIYGTVRASGAPPAVEDLESSPLQSGTGRVGFKLEWRVTPGSQNSLGTYTVTAP
jgi:hypothetical protein